LHERHRSPYTSPSRSPWRSRKCPTNKGLRLTRRSIWTRAKHHDGLERPHFLPLARGQNTTGVAPAQQAVSFGPRGVNLGGAAEENRNYLLQLRLLHLFSLGCAQASGKRGNKRHENEKTDSGKTHLAGATPLFRLSAALKVRGVAPTRYAGRVTVFCPA
jgi:hypothetical protein